MAKRKRRTESLLHKQYMQQRKRIQRYIRQREKQGFRFPSNILPDIPKRITPGSIRRLKKITAKVLLSKATALSEKDDAIISGTRRAREIFQEKQREAYFRRMRKRQDAIDYARIQSEPEWQRMFDEGEKAYEWVSSAIDNVEKSHKKAAESLSRLLDQQIEKYGRRKALIAIAQTPNNFIDMSDIALRYNPGDNRHDGAIREIYMLISGAIPDIQESKQIQDDIDADDTFEEY